MPTITSVTVQVKNKNRCSIFVDGEFLCGIPTEVAVKNRLAKGLELSKEQLDFILEEGMQQEAFDKGLTYVSKNLKTKKQVKDYLLGKGYPEKSVWACVDKLKEYGYIDDVAYSKRFIESTKNTQGKRLIEYKLMQKGVKKEDIEKAFLQLDITFESEALNVAKKHLRNKEITKENLQKTYRYLIGKGFSYEETSKAISYFKEMD